jgi:hypothetical protein
MILVPAHYMLNDKSQESTELFGVNKNLAFEHASKLSPNGSVV